VDAAAAGHRAQALKPAAGTQDAATPRFRFAEGLRGRIAQRIRADPLRAGFCAGPPDEFVDASSAPAPRAR
jgi:hypothetical protein